MDIRTAFVQCVNFVSQSTTHRRRKCAIYDCEAFGLQILGSGMEMNVLVEEQTAAPHQVRLTYAQENRYTEKLKHRLIHTQRQRKERECV